MGGKSEGQPLALCNPLIAHGALSGQALPRASSGNSVCWPEEFSVLAPAAQAEELLGFQLNLLGLSPA